MVGLAIGSVPDFYEQETKPASKAETKQEKWSFDKFVLVVELLLNLYNTHQSNQPDPQLTELVDLQRQENALIQQIGEDINRKIDRIGEWVISFGDALDEGTEAINNNTQAIEQLIDKLEDIEGVIEEQESANETMSECR